MVAESRDSAVLLPRTLNPRSDAEQRLNTQDANAAVYACDRDCADCYQQEELFAEAEG
jgi:hypothetical protein